MTEQERETAPSKRSCCVIGGGVAGIAAAIKLAEEGVEVTVLEKKGHILGRTAGWDIQNENITGEGNLDYVPMQYGYHAVFPCYISFKKLLAKANISIMQDSDYYFYYDLETKYPIGLVRGNWLQKVWVMWRFGMFSICELNFTIVCFMLCCVFYDEQRVQRWYKDQTFEEFAKKASFPKLLHRIFRTVARSLFNPEESTSTAKMILSLYHYLFKYKEGMFMHAFVDVYGQELNSPLEKLCDSLNVKIVKNVAVAGISSRRPGDFAVATEDSSNEYHFDSVIMATDMRTAEKLCRQNFQHEVFPAVIPKSQYLNARIWIDATKTDESLPTVFSTFGTVHLDFAFFVHEREEAAKNWVNRHGGKRMVMEIHSYYFPPTENVKEDILSVMLEELKTYVTIEKFYHTEIVTGNGAAHTTHHKHKAPPIDGFYLAGDYCCTSAFLLEGAVRSGEESAQDCVNFLTQ